MGVGPWSRGRVNSSGTAVEAGDITVFARPFPSDVLRTVSHAQKSGRPRRFA